MTDMRQKKYKAILLDIDGTIVKDPRDFPSPKVCEAIVKAQKRGIVVSLVTGRTREAFAYVNERLGIAVPVVLEGGARLYHPQEKRDLWSLPIPEGEVRGITKDLRSMDAPFTLYLEHTSYRSPAHAALREKMKREQPSLYVEAPWRKGKPEVAITDAALAAADLSMVTHLFISAKPDEVAEFRHLLKRYPSIDFSVNKLIWGTKGRVGFFVTHGEATKQHGVLEWGKAMGIHPHDMVAVGDEEIDYPLLMACGYKVAMGNAVQSLKDIADYIAPSVEEDGVVEVIERFLLA